MSTMIKYKNIACYHFSESFSGMSMNDAKYAEMGIRIFIYDQNTFILYVTITYDHTVTYDHTIIHYYTLTMNDSDTGPPTGDHWCMV